MTSLINYFLWLIVVVDSLLFNRPAVNSQQLFAKKPIILSHRGHHISAPENSILSFKHASKNGANGVELDVQLTKDNEVVVFHDHDLKRMTGQRGVIADSTFAQISKIPLINQYGNNFIPLLEESLKIFPDKAVVNIELKNDAKKNSEILVNKVIKIIAQHKSRLCIIISSFDHKLLSMLRKIDDSIKIGMLIDNSYPSLMSAAINYWQIKPNFLHLPVNLVSKRLINATHNINKGIILWTINNKEIGYKWMNNGVDGIITDDVRLFDKSSMLDIASL